MAASRNVNVPLKLLTFARNNIRAYRYAILCNITMHILCNLFCISMQLPHLAFLYEYGKRSEGGFILFI